MNKQTIVGIVILITVGLGGLVAVQFAWLKSEISIREQSFDSKVREALEEVASQIQDMQYQPFMDDFFTEISFMSDDPNEVLEDSKITSYIRKQGGKEYHYLKFGDIVDTVISVDIDDSSPLIHTQDFDRHQHHDGSVPSWQLDFNSIDLPPSITVRPEQLKQRFLEQREAFGKMFYRQFFNLRPIMEVIDSNSLNYLLKQELNKKGVSIDFEYGITEYEPTNFVFSSSNVCMDKLTNSPYFVELSNRSFFNFGKRLIVAFPNKNQYLLNTIWMPLSFSGFFLLMVLGAFGLALFIIFRQKQVSDLKTDFINNMTHELKTPIATISLASEMLKDPGISSKEENRIKYAAVIFDENKRLASHVEKVLQIARIEKGQLNLNKSAEDIHDIIRSVVKQFNIQIEDREAKIIFNFNAVNSKVEVDEMHITNVVNNLIDNALKYNDKKPIITISTNNNAKGIEINFKDNGIGMNKDEQKRIFEKFYRVSRGNIHNNKGFGLGLSYVKSIIEEHDGTVKFESTVGIGTTFTIFLPQINNHNE